MSSAAKKCYSLGLGPQIKILGEKFKKLKPLSKPSQQEEDQLGYKKKLIERFSKERN